jgi:hypothetical protein
MSRLEAPNARETSSGARTKEGQESRRSGACPSFVCALIPPREGLLNLPSTAPRQPPGFGASRGGWGGVFDAAVWGCRGVEDSASATVTRPTRQSGKRCAGRPTCPHLSRPVQDRVRAKTKSAAGARRLRLQAASDPRQSGSSPSWGAFRWSGAWILGPVSVPFTIMIEEGAALLAPPNSGEARSGRVGGGYRAVTFFDNLADRWVWGGFPALAE